MPKKSKDVGESKKRRASASTKDRTASTTSPSNDALLPPTPTANHLVASNPFDDPPSNNVNVPGPVIHGQSHFPMHSPMHNSGMGSPTSIQMGSPWGPNSMGPAHRGMRPYGSPSGPNWNPNPGEMMSPTNSHMLSPYQGMPMHQQQGMSPTGYSYNRPMMNHPGMPNRHQVPYHGPPNVPGGRFGEMSPERMPMSRMPMHIHSNNHSMQLAAANQMKILTRPAGPISQTNPPAPTGRKSSSSSKSDLKFARCDNGSTTPKTKKKSKASESKSNKILSNDVDEKSKPSMSRMNSKSHTSSPISSGATPPHKIPPILPQTCAKCAQEISLDDSVCCLASCHLWYHRMCAGLTIEAVECLRSEELALWACDSCVCTKEIDSVRLREQINTESHLPIVGKA